MLKLLGLICMIAGGAGVGYSMSAQVGRRYRQLKELQRLAALLMGEISYGNTPLPEGLRRIAGRLEEPFCSFVLAISSQLKRAPGVTLSEVFEECVQGYLGQSCLKETDLEALCRMGSCLGYLDKDMQMRTLRLYEAELVQEISDTYESMPGKKKLYQTLGIMGGLFLVILLI